MDTTTSENKERPSGDAAGAASLKPLRTCLYCSETNPAAVQLALALLETGCDVLRFHVTAAVSETGETAARRWLVDGIEDHVAYAYKRIEEFAPDLILFCDSEGMDEDGLLCLVAELKETPFVNWFTSALSSLLETRIDRRYRFVCYGLSDPDQAAMMRQTGYANAFEAPQTGESDSAGSPWLTRLLDAPRRLGVVNGNIKQGEMTSRVLPVEWNPMLLKLAAKLYAAELCDETDRLIAKAQEAIPPYMRDDRRFVEYLVSLGLKAPALVFLDRTVHERTDAPLCVLAGTLAREMSLYPEAVRYATRALEINPTEPGALDLIKETFNELYPPPVESEQ